MLTIDASVWVNAFSSGESGSDDSADLIRLVIDLSIPVVVPVLVLSEVAGAISRARKAPALAETFADRITKIAASGSRAYRRRAGRTGSQPCGVKVTSGCGRDLRGNRRDPKNSPRVVGP